MKAQTVTDIGQTRLINQDYVYYSLTEVGCLPNLFIVADGMGGHKAGDMASRYTVESYVSLVQSSSDKDPVSVINDTCFEVNRLLREKASESEDYEGMGTTLVVACIIDHSLKVANIGDSRLYIVNDDITQITRDHSWVEEMVSMGEINREQARTHEKKNIITRAVGGSDEVEPEMFSVDIQDGDRILMCTDGLTNMLEDTEIFQIIRNHIDLKEAAEILCREANNHGGKDNISVMLIEP
ncbi:MAG: Stp1/IreP family PP2C-type Ser/Thr phosphatase [Lachnospira sp.]|nr:Stp1/IreP family PP2C-type Ser/Thr phosphatase [Lachnospira sp.]